MSDTTSEIDALLDTPFHADDPDLHELDLQAFTTDVARGIFPPEDIARRYSMSGKGMIKVVSNPEINKLIRAKRAAFHADGNVVERLRQLAGVGLVEKLPDIFGMLSDADVTNPVKADLLKTLARIAGADGPGSSQTPNGPAPGSQFNVQIILGGVAQTIEGTNPAAHTTVVELPA